MDSSFYFTISLIAYLVSTVLYGCFLLLIKESLSRLALIGIIFGFCNHTIGLIIRAIAAGHLPLTNLYESMIFFSWTIVMVGLVVEFRYKLRVIGIFTSLFAFLTIGYASLLPLGYKEISPLVPALQSVWLEIHVIICFLSYAAFAVAFSTSIIYLIKPKKLFDDLSYRIITLGFLLLTMGIITGAIWANYAWGTYWSWDPKETWALITWLIYAVYLHTRLISGWQGKRSAWLSIIGFVATIFTYLGVNLLMAGLHSYS